MVDLSTLNADIESLLIAYPWIIYAFLGLLIWKMIWYGLAVYKTIGKKQKVWFVVLFTCAFVVNDLGIVPIIYLIINRDKKQNPVKKKK